jgi:hypothetical protein
MDQSTVGDRIEALLEQLGLRACAPGMRHGLLVLAAPAGNAVVLQVDARRQDEPVVGQGRAVGEGDRLLVTVDRFR